MGATGTGPVRRHAVEGGGSGPAAAGGGGGHRLRPHTADCIVEAWGPDRARCLAEAVLGLVAVFADVRGAGAAHPVAVSVPAGDDDEVLVRLLEYVIYLVDGFGEVPVTCRLADRADGGVEGRLEVVAAGQVELVGAVPKGVSRSGLRIDGSEGRWRCRAVVDV